MTMNSEERPRVLIVDDEKFIRDILADFLGMEGYVVRTAEDGQAALNELNLAHYDLVISDLKMPRMGGIQLLDAIGKTAPDALTVIMTGFGTVETAIDAMKRGAYDYILKPFKVEEVIHVVQRGLEKQRLAAENLRLKEALSLYKVSEAIAASLSLEEVLATVGDTAIHEIHADTGSRLDECTHADSIVTRRAGIYDDGTSRVGCGRLDAATTTSIAINCSRSSADRSVVASAVEGAAPRAGDGPPPHTSATAIATAPGQDHGFRVR